MNELDCLQNCRINRLQANAVRTALAWLVLEEFQNELITNDLCPA